MNPSTPTRRIRHARLGLAALAAFSLVAAACGDDDDGVAATPSTEAPAATDAPAVTEVPMDDMDDMDGSDDMSGAMAPTGPGCAAVPAEGEGSFGGMADDPAATAASNNPVLSTLVTAVTQAGLVDTLNGDGPYTIFAPTNDAFAAVPADQLDTVLADNDLLTSVLTYHVVAGESLSSADLAEAGTVTTVNGAELEIENDGGTLTVNGVASICQDVPTANATVHIIEGVLLPPA